MIKYLMINENNQCYGYSDYECVNTIPYEFDNSPITFEDFCSNMTAYDLINGSLVLNQDTINKQIQMMKTDGLTRLKARRRMLFQEYIDRSQLFYEDLSEVHKEELRVWRRAWLDMPVAYENGTWVEPPLPIWLQEV